MHPAQHDLLAAPGLVRPGHPLRVATYARIAEGIHAGTFPLGSALPKETELCDALGVSRTVVREALMLLQEDGLIITRRGIGRFVADTLPDVGLEELRPFEQLLSTDDSPITVQAGALQLQPTTPFTTKQLDLDNEANTWFRESTLVKDDRPIAIVQEHLPAGRYLTSASAAIARVLENAAACNSTLLSTFLTTPGITFTRATCDVAATIAGASRASLLKVNAQASLLKLTQVAEIKMRPVYMAKCIVSAEAGHVRIIQATPGH